MDFNDTDEAACKEVRWLDANATRRRRQAELQGAQRRPSS
jgi:hypothetical protein